MKILAISLFVFIFVGVLSALASVEIFGSRVDTTILVDSTTMEATVNDLEGELGVWNHTGSATYYDVSIWSIGGIVVGGFNTFLKTIAFAFGAGGYISALFPVIPAEFTGLLSAVIILIAIIGLVFWWTNRSDKGIS